MPTLGEPLDPRLERWLHEVTRTHVRAWHRRLAVHTDLWAGGPGREPVVVRDPGGLDAALRTDVATALMDRVGPEEADDEPGRDLPWLWLTRGGTLSNHDQDLAWAAAVGAAAASLGRDAWFVVVAREGWHDPASGVTRRWARVRT